MREEFGAARLAALLAREAAYRSRGGSIGRGSSLARFNAVWAGLLAAYSLLVGVSTSPSSCASSLSLGLLGLLEIFVGAFFTASTIHSIIELGLLDPLTRLPVADRTVRLAILGAAVYWGGAVLPLTVLPAACVLAARMGRLGLVPWGAAESLSAALFSLGGGFAAAALYPKARAAQGSRWASLVAWVALFGLGATFNLALVRGWLGPGALCPPHVWALPPFSYPAAAMGLGWSSAPSVAFSVLSGMSAWYGVGRLWSALSEEWAPIPEFGKRRKGRPWSPPMPYFVVKDLKLLLRDPKLLASVAYYAAVGPALLGAAALLSPTPRDALAQLPSASLLLGGVTGWVTIYLLALEGRGAGLLATLPVGPRQVVLYKCALSCLVCSPSALGMALIGARLGSASAGAAAGISYLAAVASSSSLVSSTLISRAGAQGSPKSWSLHAVGGRETLIMLGEATLYAGLAWVGDLAVTAAGRADLPAAGWASCLLLAASPAVIARETLAEHGRPGS